MKRFSGFACAVAVFIGCSANAQVVHLPSVYDDRGDSVPSQASVQIGSDGREKGTTANPQVVSCSGCGGGGGGTSGGTSTAAAPTYTEGATGQPLSMNLTGDLRVISKQSGAWSVGITGPVAVTGTFWQATQPISATSLPLPTGAATSAGLTTINTTLGTPFQAGGSIGNTSFGISGTLPAFASPPTVNLGTVGGAATAANQTTSNASLATIASVVGTTGATAPSNAMFVAGVGPSGNARGVATGTNGGLLPGQGIVTSTRTTVTASTATALETAGVATRIAESITVEATLTATVYICTTQATACSATNYDFPIPSGATAGSVYTPLFATTGRIYVYTTGTPVLVLNSWGAL